MRRMAMLLALLAACLTMAESAAAAAKSSAAEKARAALDEATFTFFKNQIKDEYPSHVKAYAIARATIAAAKTAEYCPLRTSRCGANPTCNHPKRRTTKLDITLGETLFRTGDGELPKAFKNYTHFGKITLKTGDEVCVSFYVYEKSPAKISRIMRAQAASSAKPSGGRAINLKEADSGKTVSAMVGDLVIVELPANPSTGHSWEQTPPVKLAALELKSKKFLTAAQQNPEIRPMPGQGGATTFSWQAVKAGRETISLDYRRSWEKDVKPEKTFSVTVEVAPKTTTGPVVTGKLVFDREPDLKQIGRIVVSIRNTALADGPSPLIGEVELKPPFELPVTFSVPYDPAKIHFNPMFYSISVRVNTLVNGKEKLYYINDTHHGIFSDANDTKRDVAVKQLR